MADGHETWSFFVPMPELDHPKRTCVHADVAYSARPFSTATFNYFIMSQHRSLKSSGGSVGAKRSVLKRGERIKVMKARGQWKEGRSPYNLPKTKSEA